MSAVVDIALVAVGGAAGSATRYVLERVAHRHLPTDFPLGILIANVFGSFILGVLLAAGGDRRLLFAGEGFAGALTTYSTFAHDTVRLAGQGRGRLAVGNVVVSVAASLAAVGSGLAVGASILAG